MIAVALVLAAVAPGPTAPGPKVNDENRLWWAELELEGPLSEVRLDVGPEGETRIALALVPGERRRLAVPLPVRSPLGAPALADVPLPEPLVVGEGSARVAGWSDDQPDERVARLPVGLRERPRPPPAAEPPRARAGALALVAAALVGGFALRRRPLVALLVGALAAAVIAPLAAGGRNAGTAEVRLLELAAGERPGLALAVTAGSERLGLPVDRLEATPTRARLVLELELDGERLVGVARAPGARLWGLVVEERAAGLGPGENDLGDLAETWVRAAGGAWSAHGPWRRGTPLPAARPAGERAEPPGWLRAGIAPGRGVLLARRAGPRGAWVRATGFGE